MDKDKKSKKQAKKTADEQVYEKSVQAIANNAGTFRPVSCSVGKSDILDCTEPIFFMNNSICNIPSPISVPAQSYALKIAEIADAMDEAKYPSTPIGYGKDTPGRYIEWEICASMTNLIINCLSGCMDHILSTDLFSFNRDKAKKIFNATKSQVLQYKEVEDAVQRACRISVRAIGATTLDHVFGFGDDIDSWRTMVNVKVRVIAPYASDATSVFADFANRLIHAVSMNPEVRKTVNIGSTVFTYIAVVNKNAGLGHDVFNQNTLFAAMSAMMSNYAWSFYGMAEAEIQRLVIEYIKQVTLYDKAYDRIAGTEEYDEE